MFLSLIVLLVLFIIYLIDKLNKLSVEKEKKEHISQILHGDWQIDHYCQNYNFDYFIMVQNQLKLTDKYSLHAEDKEQVTKIFDEFKKDLSQKYFSNRIIMPKTKHLISNDVFLMYHLYLFLDERHCSTFFCKECMHKETILYQSNDGDGYDATYSITEFAITVFKLLYITYMYCQNSKTLNPKGDFFKNEKYIEELIDTKTIHVSCYRP